MRAAIASARGAWKPLAAASGDDVDRVGRQRIEPRWLSGRRLRAGCSSRAKGVDGSVCGGHQALAEAVAYRPAC